MSRRIGQMLLSSSALLLAFGVASPASAQSVALAPLREQLASYAPSDRALRALRELTAATERGAEAERQEARFLRAAVGTDLLLAASIDPSRAALAADVASALGVAEDALPAFLRAELTASQRGVYRGAATRALASLTMREAALRGEAIDWSAACGTTQCGSARDLFLLRAAGDGSALVVGDPCGAGAACPEPYAQLDAASRQELASLVELGAAARRVEAAARGGDPLASLLASLVAPVGARVEGRVVEAAPRVPESLPLQSTASSGEAARPSWLLALGADTVEIGRRPSYVVRQGAPVAREEGPDVLPRTRSLTLGQDARSLEELTEALRALGEGELALGVGRDVTAQSLRRLLTALARAGRAQVGLAWRAPDGTLRTTMVALTPGSEIGGAGDLVLRLRVGGYALGRGAGASTTIPKVRDAEGRRFDREALRAQLGRMPHRRVAIEAMGSIEASDVLDAAREAASRGGQVALAY